MTIFARYRGTSRRRAELVANSALALSKLDGIERFHLTGVEDIRARALTAEGACDAVMALLADGQWALGLTVSAGEEEDVTEVESPLARTARAGSVTVRVLDYTPSLPTRAEALAWQDNVTGALVLLHHVFSRRTVEGREATDLVRAGYSQTEAAHELGVSKQAVSQRLQAAGWQAEQAGWKLAVNLLRQVAAG